LGSLSPSERAELDALLFHNAPVVSFIDWLKEVSPAWTWDWKFQTHIQTGLQQLTDRKIDRLMLFVPPRHGKSEQVTVRYTAFRIEKEPTTRAIIGAYSSFLANKFSAVEDWETMQEGGGRYVGVGGGVTGSGGDLIGIDDPVKNRKEANSATYRETVWEWYTDDLFTRCEPNAQMFLIMTRWHHDDLAGRILQSEEGKDWTVINLPACAEENDPIGREIGQALCPARYDEKALERIRQVLGESFLALYQQRPTASEGNIIKRHWFGRYDQLPHEFVRIVQSWDTAQKAEQINDPSVCTTWGETRTHRYLLHVYKKRMEYPELKKTAKSLAESWNPDAILIEDKSSGTSLIQDLRDETMMPPCGDKITRLAVVAPVYEAGIVLHPHKGKDGTPWLEDYEGELVSFPNVPHDDQTDSTSQYHEWAKIGLGIMTHDSTGDNTAGSKAYDGEGSQIDDDRGFGSVRGSGNDLGDF